jgi:hypothetical protein
MILKQKRSETMKGVVYAMGPGLVLWWLAVSLVFLGLPGCSYESRKETYHSPGSYKGARYPLNEQQHRQELIDRLRLVQTDRTS